MRTMSPKRQSSMIDIFISISLLVLIHISPVQAEDSAEIDIDSRLSFINEHLDNERSHKQIWNYGWAGISGTRLALGMSQIGTSSSDRRVVGIVDAAKSLTGLYDAFIRNPLPGLDGADSIRAMPNSTLEEKAMQLQAAESLLQKSKAWGENRRSLKQHLVYLSANLLGGAAILAFGDSDVAVNNTLVGILGGELKIFTAPQGSIRGLHDYQSRFGMVLSSFEVVPAFHGVRIAVKF
jgi:hypothetical protein